MDHQSPKLKGGWSTRLLVRETRLSRQEKEVSLLTVKKIRGRRGVKGSNRIPKPTGVRGRFTDHEGGRGTWAGTEF